MLGFSVASISYETSGDKPILQVVRIGLTSVGNRASVPHYRERVFFHGFGGKAEGEPNEFIERRDSFPDVEG